MYLSMDISWMILFLIPPAGTMVSAMDLTTVMGRTTPPTSMKTRTYTETWADKKDTPTDTKNTEDSKCTCIQQSTESQILSKVKHLTEASMAINIISAILIVSLGALLYIERHGSPSILQTCSRCNRNVSSKNKNNCESGGTDIQTANGQHNKSAVMQEPQEDAYYEKLQSTTMNVKDDEKPYEDMKQYPLPEYSNTNLS